jgi:hypothetical protein
LQTKTVSEKASFWLGGIVKRSLAMVFWPRERTIAKTFGLDDATRLVSRVTWLGMMQWE